MQLEMGSAGSWRRFRCRPGFGERFRFVLLLLPATFNVFIANGRMGRSCLLHAVSDHSRARLVQKVTLAPSLIEASPICRPSLTSGRCHVAVAPKRSPSDRIAWPRQRARRWTHSTRSSKRAERVERALRWLKNSQH